MVRNSLTFGKKGVILNMRIRIDTHRKRLLTITLGLVGLLRLIKSILYAPEIQRGLFYVSQGLFETQSNNASHSIAETH